MIPLNHSISVAIEIITTKIKGEIILILENSCMEQDGRRIAISKSNTRNKIIIKKNLVEKEDLFLEISLNPHSNWVFFSIIGMCLWEAIIIAIVSKVVIINAITINDGIVISFISF